jgi:phospholipase A-2-activating protein
VDWQPLEAGTSKGVFASRGVLADEDRTVIIWQDFKKAVRIEGHEQAVWAVRFVGEDKILTGESG